MRGRKPMPTSLKLLRGGPPSAAPRGEPQFAPSAVDPPGCLKGEALRHWRELAPLLLRAGLLTEGDRPALEMLCEEYGRIRRSRRPINADKARERYRRWLVEFGMTPSSRTRVRAAAIPQVNELDAFLSKGRGH